jgi:membrane-associated phospholipid phosphatase
MSIKNQTCGWPRLLLIGILGLVLISLAFWVDDYVGDHWKLRYRNSFYQWAGLLSKIGNWPSLLAIGTLFSLWFHVRGRIETSRLLLVVLVAGILTGFSSTIIHCAAGRTRPNAHLRQGFYGPYHNSHWTVGRYEYSSFPSGHTATVVGMTAAFWMWRRRLAVPFGIFAVAVGWSRIAMNSHHLSDVVAAAVWGVLVGPWMFTLIEPRLQGWARWWPSLAKVSRPADRVTASASPRA